MHLYGQEIAGGPERVWVGVVKGVRHPKIRYWWLPLGN
jgi:hypothetical protein